MTFAEWKQYAKEHPLAAVFFGPVLLFWPKEIQLDPGLLPIVSALVWLGLYSLIKK